MDMMLLVVDATKGMQAQTTECVVIGEAVMASGADVIVVLNKVHMSGQECKRRALCRVDSFVSPCGASGNQGWFVNLQERCVMSCRSLNTFQTHLQIFSGAAPSNVQVDLIPEEERREKLRRAKEDVAAHLAGTR